MEKYSLEIEQWGAWTLERDFANVERARQFGNQRFPENEWRIINRRGGAIVYHHDPSANIEETARLEVRRFAETERWRTIFAERAAAEVMARQNLERMAEVAARQRQRLEARRDRLRGFNFVGSRPSVLDELSGEDLDALFSPVQSGRREIFEKVNWMKEGF